MSLNSKILLFAFFFRLVRKNKKRSVTTGNENIKAVIKQVKPSRYTYSMLFEKLCFNNLFNFIVKITIILQVVTHLKLIF